MSIITYCQVTSKQGGEQCLSNVQDVQMYVDNCIVVYNELEDNIINSLKSRNVFLIKTDIVNDLSKLRELYIDKARELESDYILVTDTDEQLCIAFLKLLRNLTTFVGYNCIELYEMTIVDGFPISNILDSDLKQINAGAYNGDYFKPILFKLEPLLEVKKHPGGIHEYHYIPNPRILRLPKDLYFIHNKKISDIWTSAARMLYLAGGGLGALDKNALYRDLKPYRDNYSWIQFIEICKAGSDELDKIVSKHMADSKYLCDSESRIFAKWYFNYLHPEKGIKLSSCLFSLEKYEDQEYDRLNAIYHKVLGRNVDETGLRDYSNKPDEEIIDSLQSSIEYIDRFINTSYIQYFSRPPTSKDVTLYKNLSHLLKPGTFTEFISKIAQAVVDFPVAYCQMTFKRDLEDTIKNVEAAVRYVDYCIVVYDDTLTPEDIKRIKDAGAVARYHRWHDNFPEQRNNYILEAGAIGCKWVIVSDPDEHFDIEFLKVARSLCYQADQFGVDLLSINSHDVFTDDENGRPLDKPVENISNYYKPLIFKLTPQTFYVGSGVTKNLHETVNGPKNPGNIHKQYFYRHVKSHIEIWRHAVRNIFISGGGLSAGVTVPHYQEFCDIVKERLGIKRVNDFLKYLEAGNIDEELKRFIIKHRNDFGHDYDSEYREMFKYYFQVLHPEENVDSLTISITHPVDDYDHPKKDEIEQFVSNKYSEILNREADAQGLSFYSNEIKSGRMKKEELDVILRSSPEYLQRVRLG